MRSSTTILGETTLQRKSSEAGFTMVELLTVMAIIGILAQLSLTSLVVFRGKAEFAKAESLYRNARTAQAAGEDEVGAAFALAYTESQSNGARLAGQLANLFPSLTMPKDVILGASVTPCAGPGLAPNLIISIKPCRGDGKHIEYVRFCNGLDSIDMSSAGNGC